MDALIKESQIRIIKSDEIGSREMDAVKWGRRYCRVTTDVHMRSMTKKGEEAAVTCC